MEARLLSPFTCPVVIGRVQELTTLRSLVDRVHSGTAQVALVSGEAGIGKSRLVAETKAYAAAHSFLLLEGQCFQTDSASPYAPLLDLFRAYFARWAPTSLPDPVHSFAATLSRLLPDLALLFPDLATLPTPPAVEQTDVRVRRTHKLLWEALMAELSERTIEEITVSGICERAMVHRTTFYTYYEDKYALFQQGIRQMYDDLLAAEEHKPPNAYSVEHPPPYFIRLFEHAAQHQRFYKLMVCGEGIGRFQKLVKEYIAEVVSTKVHELPHAHQQFAVPIDMHAHVVSGATFSLLAWWLEHDMPFTPHQMAQYLLSPHGTLSPSA